MFVPLNIQRKYLSAQVREGISQDELILLVFEILHRILTIVKTCLNSVVVDIM